MKVTNSEKKPDLQVLLKLDTVENEIVLAEDDTTNIARSINVKLGKVPVLVIPLHISSRPIVEEFLKNTLKMRFMVEKIIAMSVDVKDEISLLPVTEDQTPSTSMMLTTYSPPKNF
ncbi:14169_t:CDS:2 [Ambispora leptoticha]|uniref:14169_t:CDS:1 n=1 Tax=Ambispora leptoticha TaxID=144679 RepID=A0A9N9DFN1_9GLOM|nr:14169_t:CDS:2 [Ambispora leptoticha]